MAYLVLATSFVFIAAAAASCFPGRQREASRLLAAACVMAAASWLGSAAVKEGMFSDFAALPEGLLARAVLAVVLSAALGTALAAFVTKRKK